MHVPQQSVRRDLRYPLHLPVLVQFHNEKIHARSENISVGGILLSSEFSIPEGASVDLAVGVARLPDYGMLLTARGRVRRLQPTVAGTFAVAIECDHPFELSRRKQ